MRLHILFLHQNAPGQFAHLAPYLAADLRNDVVFLGQRSPPAAAGRVRWFQYPPVQGNPGAHPYLRRMEEAVARGQAVARAILSLQDQGFVPDLVIGHGGWGETLFLRDVLPRAKILAYCEMFYRSEGQDTGYVPETTLDLDGRCRLRAWNAALLAALDGMDRGLSPTAWQKAQHPAAYQSRIAVVHDGVDTAAAAPDPQARFTVPGGPTFAPGDEVVTFVARNLEPVRGFPVLMRALPALLRHRPGAHVVICGAEGVSYGRPPPDGGTWRDAMQQEVPTDPTRVHFVGALSRRDYLALLHVSALHLYLTAPFVLSWSCIEAMAAGCLLLAADVAPVQEVVTHGVNGLLVDGRDPDAIAAAAAGMLARAPQLRPLRAQARQTAVAQFGLPRCLAAQASLIRELMG